MKDLKINAISEKIKTILQGVDSYPELMECFKNTFIEFQESKTEQDRKERLTAIKVYFQLLEPQHLDMLKKVVEELHDGVGLTSLPLDQKKKKSTLDKLGDFISPSRSDDEGVLRFSEKPTSYRELMEAIEAEKSAQAEYKKEREMQQVQQLYVNKF